MKELNFRSNELRAGERQEHFVVEVEEDTGLRYVLYRGKLWLTRIDAEEAAELSRRGALGTVRICKAIVRGISGENL